MPGVNTTSVTPASWLNVVIVIWLALAVLCTAYVAYDAFTRNPEMTVMKWGFVLVTVYLGPIGLVLYVMACKEPRPGEHEAFIKPLWRQAVGSTMHCVAGDATGILIAATVTSALGLPMWLDGTLEYAAGFGVGLLIFQALFMRGMMGGSYLGAVRSSFRSEWLSMNTMMAGMLPTMFVLMGLDMTSMEPSSIRFWAVMSIAITVGFFTAYPMNLWLVGQGLKHGMTTVRPAPKGARSVPPPPAMG
jgi:Domain of unknown function (DUF4396)